MPAPASSCRMPQQESQVPALPPPLRGVSSQAAGLRKGHRTEKACLVGVYPALVSPDLPARGRGVAGSLAGGAF